MSLTMSSIDDVEDDGKDEGEEEDDGDDDDDDDAAAAAVMQRGRISCNVCSTSVLNARKSSFFFLWLDVSFPDTY